MTALRILVSLSLVLLVGSASADEPKRPKPEPEDGSLSLERLYGGGKRITTPVPHWSWRPGHAQLVRVLTEPVKPPPEQPGKRIPPKRLLVTKDPVTGKQDILLDFSTLDALVPGKGTRMRGIGRAGPPEYEFTKSGKALCAVVKGDLVWVDLETGSSERLTETTSPMQDLNIAPDGKHLSFSRDNELFVASTDPFFDPWKLTEGGSEEIRNSSLDWVYPEEFGFSTGAWWAPDSKQIAYIQLDQRPVRQFRLPRMLDPKGEGRVMRYPKAGDKNPVVRIGVVGLHNETPKTTWLDLEGAEYVARVAWTPDSSRVLLVTFDRKQQHLKLLSCNPRTGASVVVLEEHDDCWIDTPPAPRFLEDDPTSFLWRSHADGDTRWWVVTLADGYTDVAAEFPITPPGMDAGAVLYASAKAGVAHYAGTLHSSGVSRVYSGWGNPKEVQVARSVFAGPRGFTTSASIDATGTYALVTWSDPVTPPRTELRRVKDGQTLAIMGDAKSKATEMITPARFEELSIPAKAGGQIRMQLWLPADLDEQREANPDLKLPMIVQVYAGPGSRSVRHAWGRGPYFDTLLTRKGYAVLEIDGRGTGAQGAAFKRRVYEWCGVIELQDQVAGVQHIAKRPYIDGDRVGIWGWSYGGTMACNALTMRSDVFKVGVAVAPVTDWRFYDTIYTERYMGLPSENKKGYDGTASWRYAKTMNGQLLILHGMGDDNVHAQNAFKLAEELIKHKKRNFAMMAYPWRGHGIQGAGYDVFSRLVHWFDTHL